MRKRKNVSHLVWPWFFALLIGLGAVDARAQVTVAGVPVIAANGAICSQYPGLLNRLATCVQDVVISATQIYVNGGVLFMVDTFKVMATLAVILYAISMLTGKTKSVTREGVVLAMKIGGVIFFMNGIANLFPFLIQSMSYLIQAAATYLAGFIPDLCGFNGNMWIRLDCILAHLLGVGLPGATIAMGMVGFLVASLFSGAMGVTIFFMGIAVIAVLLMTFLQAMFIYLGSMIVLALLMVISPIMIPLVILKTTKSYFEKWLKLLFTVIMQPMFLFAYLALFLLAANAVIFTGPYSVYRTITCIVPSNTSTFGGAVLQGGVVAERTGPNALFATTIDQNRKNVVCAGQVANIGAPGTVIQCATGSADPTQRDPNFGNDIFTPDKLNFEMPSIALNYQAMAANARSCVGGMNVVMYMLRVVLSLLTAATVMYVMYSLISIIPFLGATIAGEAFTLSGIVNKASGLLPKNGVMGALSKAQGGAEKMLGIK